jgi:hypothetical protein
MIKIAKRQYNVQPGETITVGVEASGTVNLVSYDLDGQGGGSLVAGQQLSFKVTTDTRVLTLLFTFSHNSGGEYVLEIKGDQGGSDTDDVDQGSFGIPAISTTYRFQL